MKTRNKYLYPIALKNDVEVSYDKSPAHVGRLKYSVDFITPEGTSIRSAFEGEVVDVKQNSEIGGFDKSFDELGNYIEIKHINNEYSIYEHIKKNGALVKVGDKVFAGQVIGYSGKTGWLASLGAHLHFDVHIYFGKGNEDYETLEICWKI